MAITQDPAAPTVLPGRNPGEGAAEGPVGTPPLESLVRLRPLNAAELLDVAAIIFLSAPFAFVGVSLLLVSVPRLALLALEVLAARQGAVFDPAGGWATVVRAGVAACVVLGLGLCSIALARMANDVWFGIGPDTRVGRRRRGHALADAVPVLVAYTALWLPVFVAGVPSWSWPNDWVPPVLLVVWLPVAVLLCIPLSLLPMTRHAEGCGIFRALERVFSLCGIGGWMRLGVAYFALSFLLAPVLVAVLVGASWVVDWLDLLDGTAPAFAVGAAVDIVALTLIASITMIVPVAAYADLRVRREGLDIQMLLSGSERGRR